MKDAKSIGSDEGRGFKIAIDMVREKIIVLKRSEGGISNMKTSKIGDIRTNTCTKKREICVDMGCDANGIKSEWVDCDTKLFEETWGQCGHCGLMSSLSGFRETFSTSVEGICERNQIKIRYVYVDSPTTLRAHHAYCETIRFKVISLTDLEKECENITSLLSGDGAFLIEIIGRDRCTGRIDMDGNDIYENDRIRCFSDSGGFIDEIVDQTTLFISSFSTKDCKVIGNKYENPDGEKDKK